MTKDTGALGTLGFEGCATTGRGRGRICHDDLARWQIVASVFPRRRTGGRAERRVPRAAQRARELTSIPGGFRHGEEWFSLWYTRPDLRILSSVLFAILTASCAAPRSVVQAPPAAPTAAGTTAASAGASAAKAPDARAIPRTPDGKPNLDGIWQVRNRAAYDLRDHAARYLMPPGAGVVVGGEIPYLPAAAKQRDENFAKRYTDDPLANCYLPGVPRIMYLEHPFEIFQTTELVAMAFEWTLAHRVIYTDGSKAHDGIEFWMGDSRGRWEGDTLVVDVTNHNDRTWFDMAGDFHSEQLHVVERYTMKDANTIQYEATMTDPKVFSRPWTIAMPFYRHIDMPRLLEYHCQAEKEEANGDFERDPRTWYPK